jgi:hypothetical protein
MQINKGAMIFADIHWQVNATLSYVQKCIDIIEIISSIESTEVTLSPSKC